MSKLIIALLILLLFTMFTLLSLIIIFTFALLIFSRRGKKEGPLAEK